jgi:benzoyl-CoA reductase subunit A
MKYAAGIDLGSTTTKAVILDEDGRILGRGITNSRSNYDLACQVALTEALITTRFGLLAGALAAGGVPPARRTKLLSGLERLFRREQYRGALRVLRDVMGRILDRTGLAGTAGEPMGRIVDTMDAEADSLFAENAARKSDFFRDLAGSRYVALAEKASREAGADFDVLNALYDKAILEVENTPMDAGGFHALVGKAQADLCGVAPSEAPVLTAAVRTAADTELEQLSSVGTGYGRARLPFPKERIRSDPRAFLTREPGKTDISSLTSGTSGTPIEIWRPFTGAF